MSQEGHLIITTPDKLSQVCAGWPTVEDGVAKRGSMTVEAALEALSDEPAFVELTMPSSMRWVLDKASIVYVGFDSDDDEEDEEAPLPCPIYELLDDDFEKCFADFSPLGVLLDRERRKDLGLRAYWFLWSY